MWIIVADPVYRFPVSRHEAVALGVRIARAVLRGGEGREEGGDGDEACDPRVRRSQRRQRRGSGAFTSRAY